jgi:hypothetical protein
MSMNACMNYSDVTHNLAFEENTEPSSAHIRARSRIQQPNKENLVRSWLPNTNVGLRFKIMWHQHLFSFAGFAEDLLIANVH